MKQEGRRYYMPIFNISWHIVEIGVVAPGFVGDGDSMTRVRKKGKNEKDEQFREKGKDGHEEEKEVR